MSETKSLEELQALKDNWLKDPCYDIYEVEQFQAYRQELIDFQTKQERKWEVAREERENKRATYVREQTGVTDESIVCDLCTWHDIETAVSSQDRYIHEMGVVEDQVKVELMQAQVRAMLLQAAQLKRIADALESMDDGNSLVTTAAIWGSEQ
jgi:methylphosphotriester-DNA--protein-cysteine methyltransferase